MGRLDFFLSSEDRASLNIKTGIISGYNTEYSIIILELNLKILIHVEKGSSRRLSIKYSAKTKREQKTKENKFFKLK